LAADLENPRFGGFQQSCHLREGPTLQVPFQLKGKPKGNAYFLSDAHMLTIREPFQSGAHSKETSSFLKSS